MTDSLKSRSPDELIKEIERLREENASLKSKILGTESLREMGAEAGKENDEFRRQSFEQGILTGRYIKAYERLKAACYGMYLGPYHTEFEQALREADEILKETK